MAKNKNKNTVKKQKTRVRALPRGLDAAGLAYAKLLADPCNAPMAHPTYSGSEGGYLIRAESVFENNSGPTATAGVFSWVPGAINASQANITTFQAALPTTSTAYAIGGGAAPAWDFLQNNASQVRCVAACLKISWGGTEANRQGRIAYGQASGGLCPASSSAAANQVFNSLPHYSRVPADEVEIVWKPNDADQLFTAPTLTGAAQDVERRAALVFAHVGLPAGVPLIIRMTAVYEWQPDFNMGVSVPNLSKTPSENTLDQVVNFLMQRGFNFVRGAAMNAGHGIGAGMIGAMSSIYGLMPAVGRTRSPRILMN